MVAMLAMSTQSTHVLSYCYLTKFWPIHISLNKGGLIANEC
jgi:hypothetical protein